MERDLCGEERKTMVTNSQTPGPSARRVLGRGDAHSLVVKALSMISPHASAPKTISRNAQIQAICDAFVHPDDAPRHDVMHALFSHGVTERELLDHVIPSAAAVLGDRWFANTLSFADVTIGAARLQEAVRAISARNRRPEIADGDRILLVVPRSEDHTLGAFVATQQFRRLGVDVQIAVELFPRQIASEVLRHRFPVVGITAAGRRSLTAAREIIDTIRGSIAWRTQIVVGGSVTALDFDIKAITGCDHVCSDPKKLIEICKLRTSSHADHVDA